MKGGRRLACASGARYRDYRWLPQGLINDTITLGQTQQCDEVILGSVGVEVETQSNLLKTDTRLFAYAECAFGSRDHLRRGLARHI